MFIKRRKHDILNIGIEEEVFFLKKGEGVKLSV